MKAIRFILLALIATLFTSCSQEDDVNEIFVGKNWYILNATFNGTGMTPDDFATFYKNGDKCYILRFTSNQFSGILSEGSTFTGNWSADGKSQSMKMQFDKEPAITNDIDNVLYKILRNTSKYEGDANVLTIKQDEGNYILLSVMR